MKGGTAVLVLVLLALLGGGAGWMFYAQQRKDDAQTFGMARFTYVVTSETYRTLERLAIINLRLGQKPDKAKEQKDYEEMQAAQAAYVQACRKCASALECENDREKIEAGRVS